MALLFLVFSAFINSPIRTMTQSHLTYSNERCPLGTKTALETFDDLKTAYSLGDDEVFIDSFSSLYWPVSEHEEVTSLRDDYFREFYYGPEGFYALGELELNRRLKPYLQNKVLAFDTLSETQQALIETLREKYREDELSRIVKGSRESYLHPYFANYYRIYWMLEYLLRQECPAEKEALNLALASDKELMEAAEKKERSFLGNAARQEICQLLEVEAKAIAEILHREECDENRDLIFAIEARLFSKEQKIRNWYHLFKIKQKKVSSPRGE